MSKIFILGYDPLPFDKGQKQFAPGIRTWQFTQPLIKDSHNVCLVCARMPTLEVDRSEEERKEKVEGMTYYSLRRDVIHQRKRIEEICNKFDPDCIIGVTHYPAYLASQLFEEKPLWIDLFGHAMAEAQVKAQSTNNDFHLQYSWNQEFPSLLRGDKFSVLSDNQKYALIGELGAVGRLNKKTADYEFCHKIPCGFFKVKGLKKDKVLRGVDVGEDDFVLLWSGGYNTWADVETLFHGLEYAMKKFKNIKFVSLGGVIKGHDEKTYPKFLELVEKSKYKGRFIFKGYVPAEDVTRYLKEADVAISIDKFSYEAIFGSRNRLLEWLFSGALVLTTRLCELSNIIEADKLGYTVEPNKYKDLGKKILEIRDSEKEASKMRKRAYEYAKKRFNFEFTTESLRDWCRAPYRAPDYRDKFSISWGSLPRSIIYMNYLKEHGFKEALNALISKYR